MRALLRRPCVALVLAAVLLSQAGCSLTGLTDFTIFECSEHAQCEPLNQRREIPPGACVRYQCAADSRCRLQPLDIDRDGHASAACAGSCDGTLPCDDCDDTAAASYPGQTEVCDGVDNDCNFVIDDVPAGVEAGSTTVVSGTDSPTWHAYGQPLAGSNVAPVSFGRVAATYFNVIDRDAIAAQPIGSAAAHVNDLSSPNITPGCPNDDVRVPEPRAAVGAGGPCTTHDECSDGVLCNGFELCDPTDGSADVMGCVTDRTEPACPTGVCNEARGVCELAPLGTSAVCNFAELVAAELGDGVWFGAVKSPGPDACGGLLRVGYFTDTMADGRLDPGRSVLFRGDVTRSTSFRGIDLISTMDGDCTGHARPDGEPLGVRSLAIAALPADPAAERLRPQALVAWLVGQPVGPSTVEVIGIWQETFSMASWVNATGDGVQQALDSAAHGDARPALLPWIGDSTAGYLIAYGANGGGIAIRFVPAFPDDDEVLRPAGTTPIMAGATAHRDTEPIADLGAEVVLPTSGAARAVQLAIGVRDGGGAELALAWHDDDGVRFSTVTFDAAAGTFTGFDARAVASGAADEIALGYTPSGVVLPGFERGGAVADESTSGGYLVAWRAGGSVSGARFAQLDGERVGPDVMRLGGDLRRLSIYLASEESDAGTERVVPRVVYHDPAAQEFRLLDAFCGPGT